MRAFPSRRVQTFRIDTQRVLSPSPDLLDDAKARFESRMDLVASGVEYIGDTLRREDLPTAMRTATRLVDHWKEGCAAYQRYARTLTAGSPLAFATAALMAQRRWQLTHVLSRMQARSLCEVVQMSNIEIQPQGLSPRVVARLSERLKIPIEVYGRGTIHSWALLRVAFNPDRSIRMTSLIIANDAQYEAMLTSADPRGQCTDYQTALAMFRELTERARLLISRSLLKVESGTHLYNVCELLNLFEHQLIERQIETMKGNLIGIDALASEIALLLNYYRKLSAVIEQAEHLEYEEQCKLETLDKAVDD